MNFHWFAYLIILFALNACTPLVQTQNTGIFVSSLTDDSFLTTDGVRLSVKTWLPGNPPKAVLVALHGFNDYRNGFAWPAVFFARNGVATIAYDQRGFGKSLQRGIWPGRHLLAGDVSQLVRLVRGVYPNTPIYLLGVSMGAAVALSASVKYDDLNVAGLILVAPAVWGGESFNWFYRSLLWTGAHLARWLKTGRGYVTLSDNNEMITAFRADDNVIASSRLDSVYGLVQLMDHVQNIVQQNKIPTYLFYGLKDEVISIEAVCLLLRKFSSPFEARFYTEGYHFLLRDLNRNKVWRDILNMVNFKGALSSRIPIECKTKESLN